MSSPKRPHGSIVYSGVYQRIQANRTNCHTSASDFTETLVGAGGFGYRDHPIVSDLIRPTPYQVWWCKATPGRAISVNGSSTSCRINPPGTPSAFTYHRTSANNTFGRVFMCPSMFYFFGGGRLNGSTSLRTVSNGMNLRFESNRVSPQIQNEIQRLENMLLLDVSRQTHQLGITLAESLKTSRYLVSASTELFQGLIALTSTKLNYRQWLRRNYKRISNRLNYRERVRYRRRCQRFLRDPNRAPWDSRIASRWMEYNYAVMPLIYDINGLFELAERQTWRPARFSVKKRGKVDISRNRHMISSSRIWSGKCTVKVLVDHSFSIDDPLKFALNRLGVNPSQFILGTAWELIPFSFVLDWALKLPQLFQGMAALQGVTWHHGYASISIKGIDHFAEIAGHTGQVSYPPTDFGILDKVPNAPKEPGAAVGGLLSANPAGICKPILYDYSGFKRMLRPRPRYRYSVDLNFITKRRAVTVLSLIAIFRRQSTQGI